MGGRGEPGDEHTRTRVTEPGHRASPVGVVPERGALLASNLLSPLHEPGTGTAVDDLVGEGAERAGAGHRGIVRVSFAAVRLRLIVNPIASSVTARVASPIAEALAEEHEVEVAHTSERDDATRLAHESAEQRFDVVVVLAGDGTLNEAARGLIGSETAFYPLPGGSTNVFARTLGVAHDPMEAATQLLRALAARSFRRIGVGLASNSEHRNRPFLFHLGAGFDAAVVARMERWSFVKRYLAHPAFALAAVDTWLRHYDRDTRLCVESGEDVVGFGPYVVVSNSDPYTYVLRRPLTISPSAQLEKPSLALTVVHDLRPRLLLRAAWSGLTTTTFLEHTDDITQRPSVHDVVITADRPFPWQVDGDYLGTVEQLRVRYEPDCVTLVIP
jgi:diacylglycerol kinase family enzyme